MDPETLILLPKRSSQLHKQAADPLNSRTVCALRAGCARDLNKIEYSLQKEILDIPFCDTSSSETFLWPLTSSNR